MYKYAAGYSFQGVRTTRLVPMRCFKIPTDHLHTFKHTNILTADSQWYAVGLVPPVLPLQSLTARPRTMADYINWVDQQEAFPELSRKRP
jgi:hypothetical protein